MTGPDSKRAEADAPLNVMLLHSSGLAGRQFRSVETELRKRGLVTLAPDLIGHGTTPPWPNDQPYDFERDLELLERHLQRAVKPFHLVGHSFGGMLALKLALRDPARVASLSLYDPVAFGLLDREKDPEWKDDLGRVKFGWGQTAEEQEEWMAGFVGYWSGRGAWGFMRPEAQRDFARAGRAMHDGARALVNDTTPASAYAKLDMPALLMTGPLTPPAERKVMQKLAATLPKARLVVFPGAGHMGPLTHALDVNAAIVDQITNPRGAHAMTE
ncbi:MAG: alpha/beta hydrolase [Deltaproteobacteria bacterium]|nr:alpha/beta hydrolase [Deltaproteobacteria bacterium]